MSRELIAGNIIALGFLVLCIWNICSLLLKGMRWRATGQGLFGIAIVSLTALVDAGWGDCGWIISLAPIVIAVAVYVRAVRKEPLRRRPPLVR